MVSREGDSTSRTGQRPVLLVLVLLAVVVAFGLVIAALVTGRPGLAWGSVVASLLAGGGLVVDGVAHRRSARGAQPPVADEPVSGTSSEHSSDGTGDDELDTAEAPDATADSDDDFDDVGDQDASDTPAMAPSVQVDEPDEEDTDAADTLVVADLADEVLVVDERPRYHLPDCGWLDDTGLSTLPLPVHEARELGFTPCAGCSPDATLAAGERRSSHDADSSTTAS